MGMKRWLACLLGLLLLGGCAKSRPIDQIQIIQQMGYDFKDDQYIGTAVYPTFKQGPMTKPNMLTTSSPTVYDLIPRLSAKSALPIEEGQLRLILFGKQFAERGIEQITHSLARNNKVGSHLFLGVAEGSAKELLDITAKTTLSDTLYLPNLIKQNEQSMNLPKTNLHLFLYRYFSPGSDPFLPYFEKKGRFVKLEGVALFRDGRYVGHVDLRDSFLMKILLGETKNGVYQLKVGERGKQGEDRVMLQNLWAKPTYKWRRDGDRHVLDVFVHIHASVRDYPSWLDEPGANLFTDVKKKMEKELEQDMRRLFHYFQEKRIDPMGIGDFVRSVTRRWDRESFYREYPDLDIRPHVTVDIIHTGIGE
ncbi:Spore germination protein A3 [Geobacillus thermodenitrificans]|nr:Spore germination protein A3 [Geobacillus thermodenitrificans]